MILKKYETTNYIRECSKLTQKGCKKRHDWVGEDDLMRIVQMMNI